MLRFCLKGARSSSGGESCLLEAYASALAADVVGGLSSGLQQVGQVERFTLYDEAALEEVTRLQACVRGLLHLELHVAEVPHAALAIGCPCECETVVKGEVCANVDVPADHRTAGIGASLGRRGAEVGIAAIAHETGQHVEGAAAGLAVAAGVAPYALQRGGADELVQARIDVFAQLVEVLRRLYALPRGLFYGLTEEVDHVM